MTPPRTWLRIVDLSIPGDRLRVFVGERTVILTRTRKCGCDVWTVSIPIADLPALIAVLQEAQAAVEDDGMEHDQLGDILKRSMQGEADE